MEKKVTAAIGAGIGAVVVSIGWFMQPTIPDYPKVVTTSEDGTISGMLMSNGEHCDINPPIVMRKGETWRVDRDHCKLTKLENAK